ncbi:hypothetical protein KAK05_03550 [Candidatus Parcubacteria bacterium]|nr:hypothetical protein [Candidatus Parcubacteria bacterium]
MVEINKENSSLQEIKNMEKELAEKKAALGVEAEDSGIEKKEVEITKENLPEQVPTQVATTQTQVQQDDDDKKVKTTATELKSLDTVGQVNKLTTLAFEKGLEHSIKIARSLNDAYLLDELHDKLVGELHEELIKKGKLKEI